MNQGQKEAESYILSGELRRDLRNKYVSDDAIDYIIFCVETNKFYRKQISQIKKIIG